MCMAPRSEHRARQAAGKTSFIISCSPSSDWNSPIDWATAFRLSNVSTLSCAPNSWKGLSVTVAVCAG